MPDAGLLSPFRKSSVWLSAFVCWTLTLWLLSERPTPEISSLDLPGFDKILHFTYFLLGALLFSIALHLRGSSAWPRNFLIVVITLATIGALDEWHQSWIPSRSGNDLGDWGADLLGALTGALICKALPTASVLKTG